MWKSLHQDESYHRSARKICLQEKKMGRASTEQQDTHLASNWLPCSTFNKGGCSLPRRNKQTTNTMHKRGWQEHFLLLWPSSRWASRCQANTQRFSGTGSLDLLIHPIKSQRAKRQPDLCSPTDTRAKLLGPARYQFLFPQHYCPALPKLFLQLGL